MSRKFWGGWVLGHLGLQEVGKGNGLQSIKRCDTHLGTLKGPHR